jgi:hypothetical protein
VLAERDGQYVCPKHMDNGKNHESDCQPKCLSQDMCSGSIGLWDTRPSTKLTRDIFFFEPPVSPRSVMMTSRNLCHRGDTNSTLLGRL